MTDKIIFERWCALLFYFMAWLIIIKKPATFAGDNI